MARNKVYLGYDDEVMTEKNSPLTDFKVNKIGGKPNWPSPENISHNPKCGMCGFDQLLVVQCYAPFDNSPFHRTLYIFACINVNCWEQSGGWSCLRSQALDEINSEDVSTKENASNNLQCVNTNWCVKADDWDDLDDMENGNVFNVVCDKAVTNVGDRVSDEDEESNSNEIEIMEYELRNLKMNDSKNANKMGESGAVGGAMGVLGGIGNSTVSAAAELEGGEEDLVTVEDIPMPNSELNFLLNQTSAFPPDVLETLSCGGLIFEGHFMSVEEEWSLGSNTTSSGDKVAELLHKYNKENGDALNAEKMCTASEGISKGSEEMEQYEDAAPHHGDRLFHAFITRLQKNPDQVLRYSRGGLPLLGAAAPRLPAPCERCGASRTYELQLMPSLSAALKLVAPDKAPGCHSAKLSLNHLHFLSVLIFTCSKSCWESTDVVLREEVIVQPQTF